MSRYGPQVLPQSYAAPMPDLAGAIADAFGTYAQQKRQRDQDEIARRRADVDMYEHGVRTGTMPSNDVRVNVPDVPQFDASVDWSSVMGGGVTGPQPTPTFNPRIDWRDVFGGNTPGGLVAEQPPAHAGHTAMDEDPRDFGLENQPLLSESTRGLSMTPPSATARALADAFRTPAGATFEPREPNPSRNTLDGDPNTRIPVAGIHPAAFHAGTAGFGTGPGQQRTLRLYANGAPDPAAIAAGNAGDALPAMPGSYRDPVLGGTTTQLRDTNPRYARLDDTHYIDTYHTPEAERDRDRMQQAAIAADYRRGDIFARGQTAVDLEGARQQGRLQLRDSINQAAASNIALRGMIQGDNQQAHDLRARTTAEDVANLRRGAAGARGSAASEANMRYAADGVIRALGGDYSKAVDWLTNTPEGQQAAKNGLAAHHLYEALGRYAGHVTDASVRLQSGGAGLSPDEAAKAVNETGSAIRGTLFPNSPDAQLTKQRQDYDAAAASLRAKRKSAVEIRSILGERP